MINSKNDSLIGATEKSLDIVELLTERNGASKSEITDHLDMPRSTIDDHLKTLNRLGYVNVDGLGTYYPSAQFLTIGGRQRSSINIYQAAKSKLHELADETGEYAALMIEEKGYGVLLAAVRGHQAVQIDIAYGMRSELHTSAPGKAILAHMPEKRIVEIITERGLESKTVHTISDREQLTVELDRIREEGFASAEEERLVGFRSIAAPIVSDNSVYYGAIGIFGPANRIDDPRLQNLIPTLKQTANVIEINLDYVER